MKGENEDGGAAGVLGYAVPRAGGAGVYFDAEDLPGTFLRGVVAAVDLCVLLIVVAGWGWVVVWFAWEGVGTPGTLLAAWGYLVVGKRFGGTVGYRLVRVKVVDLIGRPAGLGRLSWRLGVAVVLNPLVDFLWGASGGSKQLLRDKLSGTYVVWKSARPAGMGVYVMVSVSVIGWNFVYREVRPPPGREST